MPPQHNQREIIRTFKSHGLMLQPKVLQCIDAAVADPDELIPLIQKFKQQNNAKVVTKDLWDTIIASTTDTMNGSKNGNIRNKSSEDEDTDATEAEDIEEDEEGREGPPQQPTAKRPKLTPTSSNNTTLVPVVSAFDTPKLRFDTIRQEFIYESSNKDDGGLLGMAQDKLDMMAQRYLWIQQRVLAQPKFASKQLTLTTIDRLLGTSHKTVTLLGLLHNPFLLEDLTGTVVLTHLATANQLPGLEQYPTIEQSFVLVQGSYQDGVLKVHEIGVPPIHADFGWRLPPRPTKSVVPSTNELVVCSNVYLDQPEVVRQLQSMFAELQEIPVPPVIVLMGDFSSIPTLTSTRRLLDDLVDLIATQFPRLSKVGQFVLVPGPTDHMANVTLPLPPVTISNTGNKIPNWKMTTNPCRLYFGNTEVVIFRSSNSIVSGTSAVHTTLSQGHLVPLNNSTTAVPIYWNYDHALRLTPLPQLLIMGMESSIAPLHHDETSCQVVHPGCFSEGHYAHLTVNGNAIRISDSDNCKTEVELLQCADPAHDG